MNEFVKQTFTRQKLRGLFVNTALGNFVGYIAGSLVMLLTTYHTIEQRAIKNLFGALPRKQVVAHLLPEWLEWVLAVFVGFLVMEFVRYWINYGKYAELLAAHRHEPAPSAIERGSQHTSAE